MLTVLHHAHWGVDLFFVLSGFSLSQPWLARISKEPATSETLSSWRTSFFIRRAVRIYPGYLAALTLVIVAVPAVRHHPSFPTTLAAHLTLLQGYSSPGSFAIIGAAWSLSTEASFYLLWPFLAPRILTRRPSLRPWLLGAALVVSAWLLRGVFHELAPLTAAPGTFLEASQRRWAPCRIDQFILGALAAALHARMVAGISPKQRSGISMALVLLAVLALPPFFFLEGSFYGTKLGSWPYALISLATTALVLGAALCPESVARWLFPAPLRAVGLVSYGVFLNHQLALGATAPIAGPPGSWSVMGLHTALALGLSLLLAWVSWVFIERPAMEWAASRTKPGSRTGAS